METTQEGVSGTLDAAAQRLTSLVDDTPPEEESPSSQEDQGTEETSESEETTETSETSETSEETEETSDSSESKEEPQVTKFNELADHLGVEEDFLNNLKVSTKINGVEQEATIDELKQSFQKGSAADAGLRELAEERKQFNSDAEEAKSALQNEWNRIQTLSLELENVLQGDEDDLTELRETDPAEYAARVADRQEIIKKAQSLQDKTRVEFSKKVMDEYQSRLRSEQKSLFTAIPEWTDDSVAKKENSKLRTYLKGQGLQDWEIDGKVENGTIVHPGIIDHRAIVMARKAMMFDEAQTATKPKKEKLKSLPKVSSGKPKPKSEMIDDAVKAKRKKLKNSGKVEDAASLILNRMFGG